AVVHLSGRPEARRRCVARMAEGGCPFVLIEEKVDGEHCASVRADNRTGAARAGDHLHARGHRRIGFLYYADPSWPAIEERLAGFESALHAHKLPAALRWQVKEEPFEQSKTAMEAMLRREPDLTAVVCSNDVLAVGALQAAKIVGRKVPDELAIVGFDD